MLLDTMLDIVEDDEGFFDKFICDFQRDLEGYVENMHERIELYIKEFLDPTIFYPPLPYIRPTPFEVPTTHPDNDVRKFKRQSSLKYIADSPIDRKLSGYFSHVEVKRLQRIVLFPQESIWLFNNHDINYNSFTALDEVDPNFVSEIRLRALKLLFLLSIRNDEKNEVDPLFDVFHELLSDNHISPLDYSNLIRSFVRSIQRTVLEPGLKRKVFWSMTNKLSDIIFLFGNVAFDEL